MKKQEAIILSMTKKERANYLIIGPSRRKRIAHGSGTSVADVNKLSCKNSLGKVSACEVFSRDESKNAILMLTKMK